VWSGDQGRYVTSRSKSRPGYLRLNGWTIKQYRANCSNGTDTAFHRTYSCYCTEIAELFALCYCTSNNFIDSCDSNCWLCQCTAASTKRGLNALYENAVLFRDDFESSRSFNSALWYVASLLQLYCNSVKFRKCGSFYVVHLYCLPPKQKPICTQHH